MITEIQPRTRELLEDSTPKERVEGRRNVLGSGAEKRFFTGKAQRVLGRVRKAGADSAAMLRK